VAAALNAIEHKMCIVRRSQIIMGATRKYMRIELLSYILNAVVQNVHLFCVFEMIQWQYNTIQYNTILLAA